MPHYHVKALSIQVINNKGTPPPLSPLNPPTQGQHPSHQTSQETTTTKRFIHNLQSLSLSILVISPYDDSRSTILMCFSPILGGRGDLSPRPINCLSMCTALDASCHCYVVHSI